MKSNRNDLSKQRVGCVFLIQTWRIDHPRCWISELRWCNFEVEEVRRLVALRRADVVYDQHISSQRRIDDGRSQLLIRHNNLRLIGTDSAAAAKRRGRSFIRVINGLEGWSSDTEAAAPRCW